MQNPTMEKLRALKSGRKSTVTVPAANPAKLNPVDHPSLNLTAGSLPFAHKRWFVANPRVQESALND